MADLWNLLMEFVTGMFGRSFAKLFLFGILLFPIAALFGVIGLFPLKRK